MVIKCDIEAQWAMEMKNINDHVLQSFEVALDTVVETQEKVVSFIDYIWNSSAQAKKVWSEKITAPEWNASLDALEKCVKDFDKYLSIINSGFDSFNIVMCLLAGNVNGLFLELTEKVIELFTFVQIETEDHMKEVQEIIEKLRSLSPLEEG